MQSGLVAFALAGLFTVTNFSRSLPAADAKLTDKTSRLATMSSPSAVENYRINAGRSRFMARVGSGGILWFLGHVHHIAMRDFTGVAQIMPGTITPASLQLTIKAQSLEETGPKFTEQQKQTINNTMRKQVLEVEEYP
jgi:polyisoprenoid-binding protein YceI